MKKTYQKPDTMVVCVQNAQLLCNSVKSVESNAVNYGGRKSGGEARVKEQTDYNVWDENWSK